MTHRTILVIVLVAGGLVIALGSTSAHAGPPGYCGYSSADAWMYWHAHQQPWHGQHRHTAYGRPVSLVVPPIANLQTEYRWGVPSSRVTPIYHQFGRAYPGGEGGGYGGQFHPTPFWPSSTNQAGVYYVRGPW